MESLSVATALAGLMAVGSSMADFLWDLNTEPVGDSAAINTALQELKQYRSSVHLLYKTLLSGPALASLPFPERANWIRVDDLVTTLTDTVLAISELQAVCEAIDDAEQMYEQAEAQPDLQGRTVSSGDVALLRRKLEPRINSLSARIRWHNLTVVAMLTVLKCPGDSDAKSSKASVEQRMNRLLASNRDLSRRMRRLEDVYDARRLHAPSPPPSTGERPTTGHSQHATPTANTSPYPDDAVSTTTATTSSTGPKNHRWSTFTGYSLASVPMLAAVALPVVTGELRDGHEFYSADAIGRYSGSEVTEQLASPNEPEPEMEEPAKPAVVSKEGERRWLAGLGRTLRKLHRKKKKR